MRQCSIHHSQSDWHSYYGLHPETSEGIEVVDGLLTREGRREKYIWVSRFCRHGLSRACLVHEAQ
jgi:hypothetical protein